MSNSTTLALDHSLCNTGFAVYGKCIGAAVSEVVAVGLVQRKQDKTCKHAVFANILSTGHYLLHKYYPQQVVIESPNVCRSESAAASKFSVYMLAAFFAVNKVPVHYVSAKQVKAAAGLPLKASKAEMIAVMHKKYGKNLQWFRHNGKVTISKNEHIADALGVLEAYLGGKGVNT
jgi:Holliday junction resolvasome RuvABC endonuclease subunit